MDQEQQRLVRASFARSHRSPIQQRPCFMNACSPPTQRYGPCSRASGPITVAGPLRAAWLRLRQTDLIPDKGQFR
jgi:hypothetical protein